MRYSKFALLFVALALFMNLAHASISSSAASYGGAYWAYVSGSPSSGVEVTISDVNGASCTAGSGLPYSGTIYWGDGSQTVFAWTAGYIELDGGSEIVASAGQRCNVAYQNVPASSGYPAVGFSTDGVPRQNFWRQYGSLGKYSISESDNYAGGSLTLYVNQQPSISNPTLSEYSLDLGSSVTITGTVNCGVGTYCANVNYGSTNLGIVPSTYNLNNAFTPGSTGYQTIAICDQDPVASANDCGNSVYYQVYPDITAPITTYTANQLTNYVSYTYSVVIPAQQASGYTESNPSGTINFGDGHIMTLSYSYSNGNYIASTTHTYASAGTYTVTLNAQSGLYSSEGSSYGSTSTNSFSVTAITYVPPTVNTITPTNVLEVVPNAYTVNLIQGNYSIKNITISWGDGSSNTIVTSNALSDNGIMHTYPYVVGNPKTFGANVTVCDSKGICTTSPQGIITHYVAPTVDSVSPSNTYATLSTAFTFNVIKGDSSLSSLQVLWGDSSSTFNAIYSTSPSFYHTYNTPGNYVISVTAIDSNAVSSATLTKNVELFPYVPPRISELSPSAVSAGNTVTFTFNAINGSFAFRTWNAVQVEFISGNTVTVNTIKSGTNNAMFDYLVNGNFSVLETIYDKNGFTGTNVTLVSVSEYPWNFTSPQLLINYNITSNPQPIFIQTTETDSLNVSYTIQKDNLANDYICTPSISASGLFAISCIANPNAVNYNAQTLYVSIYAKDTDGIVKSLTEQVNLIPKISAPVVPATPINTSSLASPYKVAQYTPISPWLIILVIAILLIGFVGIYKYIILKR